MEPIEKRVETRGRKPKVPPPPVNPRIEAFHKEHAPKLEAIMALIKKEFRTMHGFLKEWTLNPDPNLSQARQGFFNGAGCGEVIGLWLGRSTKPPQELIHDMFFKEMEGEVVKMLKDTSAPIRHARKGVKTVKAGSITTSLNEMEQYIRENAPVVWKFCDKIATGLVVRRNKPKVVMSSILNMLNCRNQTVNGLQTNMGVYLYANHIPKSTMEVLRELSICSSNPHVVEVLRSIAKELKLTASEWATRVAVLMNLDNVNQMVGVRDATSTRSGALMVNSTGGFATPVFGMPEGYRFIPREWMKPAARVEFEPRMLEPTEAALDYFSNSCEWYLANLLSSHIEKLPRGEDEFRRPEIEVLHLEAPDVLAFDLMNIEQSSTAGNLQGIGRVLTSEFKYTKSDLAEGLFLVGGDQLLADRVRSIQKARESDVPGEDFSFVVPVLGPLHTCMNYKKMQLKHHLGEKSGSRLGSLSYFNRKLRRNYVDEKVGNFWACMDFTRDSLDGAAMALMVAEGAENNWDSFRAKVMTGDINWRNIVKAVTGKLAYRYVEGLRVCEDDERDRVYENLLLFMRSEIELTAFYKSMRGGDFIAGGGIKYGPELMDIRCGMLGEWDDRLKQIIRRNWIINPRGREGKALGLDEFMEEIVRAYKQQYNPGGSENLEDFQRKVIARCVLYLTGIKEDMRTGLGIRRHAGNRTRQDRVPDIISVMEMLLDDDVVKHVAGRGKATVQTPAETEVKDWMMDGLEKMRDGKWWPAFLARSPGCSRVKRLKTLGMADESDESDESDDDDEDAMDVAE
ncbi:hypothetical protein BDZ91DRAFT_838517 [Kalaharituber pfeilii]|nr:hypothetical protein BDZ91DRAFT_838517 [Kalaharituber pfeilii]